MKPHLEHYVSPKTGRTLPLPKGKGYRRGCRCTDCVDEYKAKKQAERERRLTTKDVPAHVHGTWNGYTNYGCRCMMCLQASRENNREYAAEYRELHRDEKNARRREYYLEVKAAEQAQDLKRKGK